jgi:hypothetical protein
MMRQTTMLGVFSVPVTAQALLLAPASASGAPSPECIIKGNVNRKGERIYHRPGGASYAQVNMNAAGKRWFCTEDEAQPLAGDRQSGDALTMAKTPATEMIAAELTMPERVTGNGRFREPPGGTWY